jgi:hypothetical protein
MTRIRLALCALLLALCVLPFTLAGRFPVESVCFYFPDGHTLNLPLVGQPSRGDALGIRAASVETAIRHRAKVTSDGTATGWEDRMVLAAAMGPQEEGGLSCVEGRYRSGMKGWKCTCDAAGGGCVRVIIQ